MSEEALKVNSALYHYDFSRWAIETAHLIREKKFDCIEIESMADEVEAWHYDNKCLLSRHLVRALVSLLKYDYAFHLRALLKACWYNDLIEARIMLGQILSSNPSMEKNFMDDYEDEYKYAKLKAAAEVGINESHFPKECPWTLDQVLDSSFHPAIKYPGINLTIISVAIIDDYIVIKLSDERILNIPVHWYTWLEYATDIERNEFQIIGNKDEILWKNIDHNIVTLPEVLRCHFN